MSETIFFFLYFVLQDYIHIKDVPPPVVMLSIAANNFAFWVIG